MPTEFQGEGQRVWNVVSSAGLIGIMCIFYLCLVFDFALTEVVLKVHLNYGLYGFSMFIHNHIKLSMQYYYITYLMSIE